MPNHKGTRAPKALRVCEECGAEFLEYCGKKTFLCSKSCAGVRLARRHAAKREDKKCEECGAAFSVPRYRSSTARFCSSECRASCCGRTQAIALSNRRRGTGKKAKYVKEGGEYQHRKVAREQLGRELLPGEVVHHIDGDGKNNDPNNLVVITASEHSRVHHPRLAGPCFVKGCDRERYALGMCSRHYQSYYKKRKAGMFLA